MEPTPPNSFVHSPTICNAYTNLNLLGKHPHVQRNIIFIGETGAGKSSTISLLLGRGTHTPVSSGSRQTSTRYVTTLNGIECILWDTRGLGRKRSWYQYIFEGSPEKEIKTFLKEKHRRREIDLLVYCICGLRAVTASAASLYGSLCAATRRLAVPVAIVVTHLEEEANMEDWWTGNSPGMRELGMIFDDHACITALPGHPREADCRKRLADLITDNHRREPKESGSYLGSPTLVRTSTPSTGTALHKGMAQHIPEVTGRAGVVEGGLSRCLSNESGTPSIAHSQTGSSYHTATSLDELTVPSAVESPHSNSVDMQLLEPYSEGKDHSFTEPLFKRSHATIRKRISYPTRSGAFGDIWECDLVSGKSSFMVAVKAVRTNISDSEDSTHLEKKLRRELKVWERLQHRNIVPLLGVVSGFGRLPSPVSRWFCNGSLSHHMTHHQLSLFEKHRLLGDIAVGLCYLHNQGVVHGNLHSDNILIDDDGTACLTDFSLSLISDFAGTSYLKFGTCSVIYFADPALVKRAYASRDTAAYPTKSCDIYSFGGIMLHVLSGKRPYERILPAMTLLMITNSERSEIPTHDHITHPHKSLIQMCWQPEECKRPSAYYLVREFDRRL